MTNIAVGNSFMIPNSLRMIHPVYISWCISEVMTERAKFESALCRIRIEYI